MVGVQTVVRRHLLTFVAIAASTTLVMNAPGSHPGGSEVRRRIGLAAQAAEVPVPRPLPLEVVESLSSAPSAPSAGAAVAVAPPPAQFTGPAPARVAPPAPLRSAARASSAPSGQPGTWAVVIGVNDYPGSQYDLNYAVNDANDATQALAQQGVSGDHVMNLRDGQVTPEVIRSAVNWLANNAGPDAVAVFFFAGHVMKKGGSEVIVTSDGGNVSDAQLANWLSALQARRAWITIAACYGGGFTEVLAPGRVLTAAAGANEVAYESSAFGRSYLGEYMLRRAMIEGAANSTVQSAFAWARAKISQEYSGREPVQFDSSDGSLNLRPAQASAGSEQPAQAAPAQPAPSPEPAPDQGTPPTTAPPKKCGIICFR